MFLGCKGNKTKLFILLWTSSVLQSNLALSFPLLGVALLAGAPEKLPENSKKSSQKSKDEKSSTSVRPT